MKTRKKVLTLTLIVMAGTSLFLTQCKKDTETVYVDKEKIVYVDPNDTGTIVPGAGLIDLVHDADTVAPKTKWTFEKNHSNVNWQSKYYDFSSTMLTGRFNSFGWNPGLIFDETDLSKCSINFWVQMSSNNTSEPGRDSLGMCGPKYVGVVYLDTMKRLIDPASDTAYFRMNTTGGITFDSHAGYTVHGKLIFNRYRTPSGFADGTPVEKPLDVHLSYNGKKYFAPSSGTGAGTLRAGMTATFKFNRSDFIDINATQAYYPVPKSTDLANNATAANNKTYGAYSLSVGDEMDITINAVFTKKYIQ